MKSQPNIILEDEQIIAALIGLGSNVDSEYGACLEVLKLALQELSKLTVRPLVASSFYESEPVDCPPGSPNFVNAVAALFLPIDTDVELFYNQLDQLEGRLGRARSGVVHEPRVIDLDLLYFGHKSISTRRLMVPHPRALDRLFVLQPLAEIAPYLVLPGQDLAVIDLLNAMPCRSEVRQMVC